MEMSSSQPSHIIYEKEAAIEIDYNTLEEGKCAIVYATKFYIFIYILNASCGPRCIFWSPSFKVEKKFPE